MASHTEILASWLEDDPLIIGQARIVRQDDGFWITHKEDHPEDAGMEHFEGAAAARTIACTDDDGAFRPLKSAPNLRHGWRLRLADADELKRAIDFLYPASIALAIALECGRLKPTPLRDTLGRQTGMYRVAGKISDGDADELVGSVCQSDSGCLRKILWPISDTHPLGSLPQEKTSAPDVEKMVATDKEIPLLCCEACCLLVAAARKHVKSRQKNEGSPGKQTQ